MVMPWSILGALKDGQFHKVLSPDAWADFKPLMFAMIEQKGKFIIQVELKCGCLLPLFYEVTAAHLTDGSQRDVLVSRIAQPKDWEEQCPFRVLPESAKGQPILAFRTEWSHDEVKAALARLEEDDAWRHPETEAPQPISLRAERRRRAKASLNRGRR